VTQAKAGGWSPALARAAIPSARGAIPGSVPGRTRVPCPRRAREPVPAGRPGPALGPMPVSVRGPGPTARPAPVPIR
jgi:hypothetical protein